VAHIVDGTIVLDKKVLMTAREASFYKKEIGDVVRFIRIDGCRLTGHDSRIWVFEITPEGTINIIAPLSDYIKR
jgi:KaiC/GvpD/RAD55 family RecA-like ATPase